MRTLNLASRLSTPFFRNGPHRRFIRSSRCASACMAARSLPADTATPSPTSMRLARSPSAGSRRTTSAPDGAGPTVRTIASTFMDTRR